MTDYLIDNLSDSLHFPSSHRSRYLSHTYEEREEKLQATERSFTPHREYLYNKYGKFGGTWTPRLPRRSTQDPSWYKQIARDMGHPRSPTPILKHRSESRPLSQASMYSSTNELRPASPAMSQSRPYSPYLLPRNRSMSPTRASSPKHHEKSVVIGPVTDMVTNERREPKQEFYRYRDAQQGKVGRKLLSTLRKKAYSTQTFQYSQVNLSVTLLL